MKDDKDIIQTMQEDSRKGFRLLMARYREPLYWHIRRLVVSHADAQDVAQETFIRVFRNFDQYDRKNSLRAWLFRIATNEALRLLGRRKNQQMLSLDDVPAVAMGTIQDDHFDSSDEIAVRLQQAIGELPAKQQLAFNMRYYDDMSYEEIAQVTGSTAANIKANYHFAKDKIIKRLRG